MLEKEGLIMLVAERQQKILDLVNEKKSIRVTQLSKLFSVTEETIRRDLEKLELEQKLTRSHGGAVSISPSISTELSFSEREVKNVKEKREIAYKAVKQVKEGDEIVLDASSTAWYMAKALPDIPLTVITNSNRVVMELSVKNQINVISTGGTLISKTMSFTGPLAEAAFDTYHVGKTFISCSGFHMKHGISESDEMQARIKNIMMESADTVYVLVDHTKFDVKAFYRLSGIDVADFIITDSKTNNQIIEQLEEKSIQVIKAQKNEK